MLEHDTPALRARFAAKIAISGPDDCWLWLASADRRGYGYFAVHGRLRRANRVAWELANGPIPEGLQVLHNCPGGDDPRCVNPKHLWLGTNAQNRADAVAKGQMLRGDRHPARTRPEALARGDRHGARLHPDRIRRGEQATARKLTEQEVRAIRRAYAAKEASQPTLGVRFGVTQSTIWAIVRRRTWAHLE